LLLQSRFRVTFLLLAVASGGAAAAIACGDSGDSSGTTSADADGGPSTLPDAAIGPSDGGTPATTMRLAHVAADLGAVDFCYRMATTSSFEGPVLGGGLGTNKPDASDGDAEAGASGGGGDTPDPDPDAGSDDDGGGGQDEGGLDAGAPSVTYRTVSRYVSLDVSGPLTIALVAPGSPSCATPLFTADVTLDPGKLSTVAIIGRDATEDGGDAGDGKLSLVAFTDDRSITPDKARVRMIHAAFGLTGGREAAGPLAVRATASQTVTVADHVDPKKQASPSATVPVDSLGYATIVPLPSPAQLAVGAAAGTPAVDDASIDSWVSAAGELGLSGSSLHTGFILTGVAQPFEVLWCTDTTTVGDRTTCALIR
jgi:hypothetical protein